MPNAKHTACSTACIFFGERMVIKPPRFCFGTVCKLSKLTADSVETPSSTGNNTTSVGICRIVDVIGATMTPVRTSKAESRVKIKTGRRLSGGRKVYQRISPLFIVPLPTFVHFATRQILLVLLDIVCNQQYAVVPVRIFAFVSAPAVKLGAKMLTDLFLTAGQPYPLRLTDPHQLSSGSFSWLYTPL